ncbi:uncharacterized protein LOC134783322 [Penaeus indicus]|uniref:uncharacterized protein LOC134783322 n=1 Tax=Penaeus indicus TaxID=29960 RepID=UPI00300D4262
MEKEENEKCVVGGDLNGHIGRGNDVISRVNGGNSFGEVNEGDGVIDFAVSNDMTISDTILRKRQEHLITSKSGHGASQIDFLLYRRCDRVEIKDFKVIPGDHVAAQHRLVEMNLSIRVSQTIAKCEAYGQFDGELETREGLGKIFRIAKKRNNSTKYIIHIRQVKDDYENTLRKEANIIKGWKLYFEHLLNEENERRVRGCGDPNYGVVREVSKHKVELALRKMKCGKAAGPDNISVESTWCHEGLQTGPSLTPHERSQGAGQAITS